MSLQHLDINKNKDNKTQNVIKEIISNNGQVYLVGGALRDLVLGFSFNDLDFEIYNIPFENLKSIINKSFTNIYINETFKTIKASKAEFALPRIEIKTGLRYNSYELEFNINMNLKQATLRRDFTMNTLMYSFNNDCLIDQFNALNDIQNKIIKAVDYTRYKEDSIRSLRLLKYKFKLNFNVDEMTEKLSIEMARDLYCQNKTFTIPLFNSIFKSKYFDASYLLLILHKLFTVKQDNILYNIIGSASFDDVFKNRQVLFFVLLYINQPIDNHILDICIGKEKTKQEIINTIKYLKQNKINFKNNIKYEDLKRR